MKSYNHTILIGRLGQDVEIVSFPNGGSIGKCSIAIRESWKDKTTGEWREATDWFQVRFSEASAPIAARILKKGMWARVCGRFRNRKYMKGDVEVTATELYVSDFDPIETTGGKEEGRPAAPSRAPSPARTSGYPTGVAEGHPSAGEEDDSIPF